MKGISGISPVLALAAVIISAAVLLPVRGDAPAESAGAPNQATGSVIAHLFEDMDGDGVLEAGDNPPMVADWWTELYSGSDCSGASLDSEAVNWPGDNGDATYGDLAAGSYSVEVGPINAVWVMTTAGCQNVTVVGGEAATLNFGVFVLGSVEGTVYNDLDGSGDQDPGEPGLSWDDGWSVGLLYDDGDGIIDEWGLLDDDGHYAFDTLGAGVYRVVVPSYVAWGQTTADPAPFTVQSGSNFAAVDFGWQYFFVDSDGDSIADELDNCPSDPNPFQEDYDEDMVGDACDNCEYYDNGGQEDNDDPPDGVGDSCDLDPPAIIVHIFEDFNGNGVMEAGDDPPQVVDWGTDLYEEPGCTGDALIHQARMDDGNAIYGSRPAGTYYAHVEPANEAWSMTTSGCQAVTITDDDSEPVTVSFGVFELGTISGTVWNDADGDGVRDPDELLQPGWEIDLDRNVDGTVDEVTYSSMWDGSYSFDGLVPGTYRVREVGQSGWGQMNADPSDFAVQSGSSWADVDFGNAPDYDGDLVSDLLDNCVDDPNHDQADLDHDGSGDACDFIPGDSNGNGSVSMADAMYIAQYVAHLRPAGELNLYGADTNCADGATMVDAMRIAQLVAHLRTELVCN